MGPPRLEEIPPLPAHLAGWAVRGVRVLPPPDPAVQLPAFVRLRMA